MSLRKWARFDVPTWNRCAWRFWQVHLYNDVSFALMQYVQQGTLLDVSPYIKISPTQNIKNKKMNPKKKITKKNLKKIKKNYKKNKLKKKSKIFFFSTYVTLPKKKNIFYNRLSICTNNKSKRWMKHLFFIIRSRCSKLWRLCTRRKKEKKRNFFKLTFLTRPNTNFHSNIIHADIKPDNFLILLDESAQQWENWRPGPGK